MESKAHFYAPRFEAGAGAQQDTDAGAAEAAAPLPLDLASAPLVRVRLYHRGGDSAVLVWTAHHIAADFWSLAVLLSEFRELYAACAAGRVAALVPVVADYPDYVREL